MRKYERPEIKFADVRLNEGIADTCWGLKPNHPNDVAHYYDVDGPGYVSFHVKRKTSDKNGCSTPDAYSIVYYEYKGAEGVDGNKYDMEVEAALSASQGGNSGQPYKNFSINFPTKPDESWS